MRGLTFFWSKLEQRAFPSFSPWIARCFLGAEPCDSRIGHGRNSPSRSTTDHRPDGWICVVLLCKRDSDCHRVHLYLPICLLTCLLSLSLGLFLFLHTYLQSSPTPSRDRPRRSGHSSFSSVSTEAGHCDVQTPLGTDIWRYVFINIPLCVCVARCLHFYFFFKLILLILHNLCN